MGFLFAEEEENRRTYAELWEKDPKQAEREAEKTVCEALRADRLCCALREELAECKARVDSLMATAKTAAERFQGSGTIFSTAGADGRAFSSFCAELRRIEEEMRLLRMAMGRQIVALIPRERAASVLRAEALLRARPQTADERSVACARLLSELVRDSERIAAILSVQEHASSALRDFCEQTVPQFCERASLAADVQGEGRDFRSVAVRDAFGALAFAARSLSERLSEQIKKVDLLK